MDQKERIAEKIEFPICRLCGLGYHDPRPFHGKVEYNRLYQRLYTAESRGYKRGEYKKKEKSALSAV